MKQEKGAFGFDADKEEYVDMMEAGVIDPTKVVRLALQNAARSCNFFLESSSSKWLEK